MLNADAELTPEQQAEIDAAMVEDDHVLDAEAAEEAGAPAKLEEVVQQGDGTGSLPDAYSIV